MGNPYNGFSAAERVKKLVEMHRQIASGALAAPHGPCRLCNDPGDAIEVNQFEYHDEDYSRDYSWAEPFAFVVCRLCHSRIHARFKHPIVWQSFLAHVRRGGYARELQDAAMKREVVAWRRLLGSDTRLPLLRQVRPYAAIPGTEWFSKLSSEPVQIADTGVRSNKE